MHRELISWPSSTMVSEERRSEECGGVRINDGVGKMGSWTVGGGRDCRDEGWVVKWNKLSKWFECSGGGGGVV